MATFNLTTTPVEIDSGASDFIAVTNTGNERIIILRDGQEVEQLRQGARGVYYLEDDLPFTARTVSGTGSVEVIATAKNPDLLNRAIGSAAGLAIVFGS